MLYTVGMSNLFEQPDWATQIIEDISIKYDVWTEVIWKFSTSTHGLYDVTAGMIKMFVRIGRENDTRTKGVIVHEVAHAIREQHGNPREDHDRKFFEIAYELYLQYDLIEWALAEEYAQGKKIIQELEAKRKLAHCI